MWVGDGRERDTRERKTGCYSEENRLTSLRFSESRILNRLVGSSCRLLNRKPDAGALREYHNTVSRVCHIDVYLRVCSRLCYAKYHLPYRDVYYAALNPAIHMGCRRTRNLSTNVTRRRFLNLGLYPGATRDAFS